MTVRTTVVQGQIVNPLTNRVVANKRLSVRLNPSVCYSLDGTQQIIRSSWITTDSLGFIRAEDGSLGEAFQVNVDLDPAGSYYTVQVAPGLIDSLIVRYSATPVTYRSCLVSNPANPNPLVAGASVQQLTDETTRATAAEQANATAITNETTRATAAEVANANSITTLAGAVTSEATTRANADTTNANAIAAETNARQALATSLPGTYGPGSVQWLESIAAGFGFAFTSLTTVDTPTGLPTAANIKWPDGTAGTFTGTTDGSNGYTSYSATYGAKTVSASGITYDTATGLALGPTSLAVA